MEKIPHLERFYEGRRLSKSIASRILKMRAQWTGVEPLALFLTAVKNLFTAEKHRCHFESTVEYEAFGEFRYFNRIYYEVSLHSSSVFNEEAFRESLLNFDSL